MINFREMQDTEEDYRLLLSWFSNPEVFRWYGREDFPDGVSLDRVKEKYRLRCLKADAVTPAVIEIDYSIIKPMTVRERAMSGGLICLLGKMISETGAMVPPY